MNIHEQIEICEKRDYYVVKANQIIQKSRYDLTLTEQRAVAYICSMIKPVEPSPATHNAAYQLDYEFDILEYAKICGLHYTDGGKLYKETKAILKRLMQKIIEVEINYNDEAVLLAWLTTARVSKRSGKVKIEINKNMAPFLFSLKKNFT